MSGFVEARFPEGISYGSSGGPQFRTTVETRGNGQEKRVKEWPSPLWKFDARKGVVDETSYLELLGFFLAVAQGRFSGFRYKDPTDFQVTSQQLDTSIPSGVYLLRKTYTFGSLTFQRRITKPVTGTLALTVNSTPVTVFDAATVGVDGGLWDQETWDEALFGETGDAVICDYTTGILTWFTSPYPGPSDDLRATFQFDVPARFDTDALEATYSNFQVYQTSVPILELRQK